MSHPLHKQATNSQYGYALLLNDPIESLSFALYGKRQTPGKEKFYGIRQ